MRFIPRHGTPGLLVAALVAPLALVGCDEEGEGGGFRSEIGIVPASPQRTGDPEAGYRALVNEPYVSCGMPYDAFRRISPDTAPSDLLPGRDGRNAEIPYALTAHVNESGVEIVSNNCLTCHAGRIGDELIVGLGNEFADFTQDQQRVALRVGNVVSGEAETRAWEHWADRIAGIAPYIQTATVGVNPAANLTWALMAHRDPETLEWSEEPLMNPPPTDPLPVSVPPWWGMRKKNAMFYTTIGRGDHAHFMLLASMMCIESTEELAVVDTYAPDIRAYITSLEAPAFPFPIDETLASEGEAIFRRECAECHGIYGSEESFPNQVYGLEDVGTDPTYALAATDGSRDRFYGWLAKSPYGDRDSAAPARGYVAPPLDGVWATAPYLHNGSVPDMETLLSSRLRPTYWRHRTEPRSYSPERLGWRYDALATGQAQEPDPAQRRQIYDTTLKGYGNMGHTYSDHMNSAEREALMEYLKTL